MESPRPNRLLITRIAVGTWLATMLATQAGAATVVGSIAGEFNVEQGNASYSIPITVAPGRGGMAPTLSLNYGGGGGTVGLGWSLGGMSSITRCGRTKAQDSAVAGIKLNNEDKFCLDGQRLVAIAGTYGASGTEYRTEIDSNSKIVSYGSAGSGPSWWKVWTKSGQVMEYGHTDASQVWAAGHPEVFSWSVNSINDTTGANTILISYNEEPANSFNYPTQIDYPGGRVTFNYEDNDLLTSAYIAGATFRSTKRLTSIQTWSGTGGPDLFQTWQLTYSTETNKPARLSQLKVCAANGDCLPATQFTWGKPPTPNRTGGYGDHHQVDVGPGVESNENVQFADLNADGLTDLIRIGLNQKVYAALGQGNGTFGAYVTSEGPGGSAPEHVFFVDFDADGRTDMIKTDGVGTVYTYRSQGDGSFSAAGSTFGPGGYSPATSNPTSSTYFSLPDINSDGRNDVALINGSRTKVSLYLANSDGSLTFLPSTSIGPYMSYGYNGFGLTVNFVDANEDGIPDVLFSNGDSNATYHAVADGSYTVFVGTEVLSGLPVYSGNGSSGESESNKGEILFADVNGDGLSDLIKTREVDGRIYVYLGLGTGHFAPPRHHSTAQAVANTGMCALAT